jgi:uncharacterized protein (TIGR02266 family)
MSKGRREERREPRYAAKWAVRLEVRSWSHFERVYTRNISQGGMMFATRRPVAVGERVHLSVTLPNDSVLELDATVRHILRPGDPGNDGPDPLVGVRLDDLDEPSRSLLTAAVAALAASE